jgi:hypothetical protein
MKKEGYDYKRKKTEHGKIYYWMNVKLKDYTKVDEDQETF